MDCKLFTCSTCGAQGVPSRDAWEGLLLACPACGPRLLQWRDIPLQAGEEELLHTPREVLGRSWFHATLAGPWPQERGGATFLHLGSEVAARERWTMLQRIARHRGREWVLHEIFLKEEAQVDGVIYQDGLLTGGKRLPLPIESPHGVHLYVNAREDFGSVSLAVRPEALSKVVATYPFPS